VGVKHTSALGNLAAWPSVAGDAPTCLWEALAEHWARVPLLAALGGL
jgi:hypothetical protein